MIDPAEFMIVINEDGTSIENPYTNEYQKLKEKYPACKYAGYNCMFCGKCLLGDYFKPANDQERLIIEEQNRVSTEYFLEHNPSLRGKINV